MFHAAQRDLGKRDDRGLGGGTRFQRFKWSFAAFFCAVHILAFAAPLYFTWQAFAWAILLNILFGGLGVSVGYHRLLSHGSYSAPRWFEYIIVTLGLLGLQGAPISWSGMHRRHHQTSDTLDDPHSSARGFWWSYVGWAFFLTQNDYCRYASVRVQRDPLYRFYGRRLMFVLPQVPLALLLYAVGGLPFLFWCGFARIVMLWHTAFLVNSATHRWGYRNYDTEDRSRNNWWMAILAYGEGWHNNHHAEPRSATFSRRWWEFDLGWQFLRLFRGIRLVRDVTVPRRS